jgi:hypothetical protein
VTGTAAIVARSTSPRETVIHGLQAALAERWALVGGWPRTLKYVE